MPEDSYQLARRRIRNNAKRRKQHSLDLSGKNLTALPPEIGELAELSELILNDNQLTTLPAEMGNLASLKVLKLNGNKVRSLPDELSKLSSLLQLEIQFNDLEEFPRPILRLSGLRTLKLTGNRIGSLPPDIRNLTELRHIEINQTGISSIPAEIGQLTSLTILELGGNKLSELPRELSQLERLGFLALDFNEFSEFPNVVFGLRQLSYLYLNNNRIRVVPGQIGSLQDLLLLDLSNNEISSLPAEIGQLGNLVHLDLSKNSLTSLPSELGNVRTLESAAMKAARSKGTQAPRGLFVEGNQFPAPYRTLLAPGQPYSTAHVLAWLRGELDPENLPVEDVESDPASDEISEEEIKGALKQRPASFRFGVRDGKIDTLSEQPEATDIHVATDLHAELLAKTEALNARLSQTNSDARARSSTSRLIAELNRGPRGMRPGILLSRSRSIEADRNAFDTEEGRQELFPDAIAMMDDVLLSLQDLMAIYPIIREIEAERAALALQSDIVTLEAIGANTGEIKAAAATSDIVTQAAAEALRESDNEIRDAREIVVQARLVADQLLVIRNFAGGVALFTRQALLSGGKRAASELGELGSKSWDEVKNNLPKGIGAASRALPIVALIGLLASITGPIGGIAGALATFKPLSKALRKIIDSSERETKPTTRGKPKG